jgi:hypothetical protein
MSHSGNRCLIERRLLFELSFRIQISHMTEIDYYFRQFASSYELLHKESIGWLCRRRWEMQMGKICTTNEKVSTQPAYI